MLSIVEAIKPSNFLSELLTLLVDGKIAEIFSQLIVNHVLFEAVPDSFTGISTQKVSGNITLSDCAGIPEDLRTGKWLLLNVSAKAARILLNN